MEEEFLNAQVPSITEEEHLKLENQNSRGIITAYHQNKLEMDVIKNWDRFYKRNETRFFKDRHWTTREFVELIDKGTTTLLEIGCGVGNFFFPLLKDGLDLYVHACDFSPRAISLVKENPLYNAGKINAFVCDLTRDNLKPNIVDNSVNIASCIFVLSAILPEKIPIVLKKVYDVLDNDGLILIRDYAVNDMAMIRFGPGSKLAERFYVRQDNTRAYYFTKEELGQMLTEVGFEIMHLDYVIRRTVNKKEGVNARRVYVQAKARKKML